MKVLSHRRSNNDASNDDALADSVLDLLGGDNLKELFDTDTLKKAKPKSTQDRVGQRTPCPDFSRYIPIFNKIMDAMTPISIQYPLSKVRLRYKWRCLHLGRINVL